MHGYSPFCPWQDGLAFPWWMSHCVLMSLRRSKNPTANSKMLEDEDVAGRADRNESLIKKRKMHVCFQRHWPSQSDWSLPYTVVGLWEKGLSWCLIQEILIACFSVLQTKSLMYCWTALKPCSNGFPEELYYVFFFILYTTFHMPERWSKSLSLHFLLFDSCYQAHRDTHTATEFRGAVWCSHEQAVVSGLTVQLFRAIRSFIKSLIRMWRVHGKQWKTKKSI